MTHALRSAAKYLMVAAALFVFSTQDASAQAMSSSKTSTLSTEVITIKLTSPSAGSDQTFRISCPGGVSAIIDLPDGSKGQCDQDYRIPTAVNPTTGVPVLVTNLTAALLNTTTAQQTVSLSYVTKRPTLGSAPVTKTVAVKVSSIASPNKTVLEASSVLRVTFSFTQKEPGSFRFTCPPNVSALQGANASRIDLCQTSLVFASGVNHPAYIDVTVVNKNTQSVEIVPHITLSEDALFPGGAEVRLSPVAVLAPVRFQNASIKSKDTAALVMSFPANTKGTVKLECPDMDGISTSFAGKCETEVSYNALPATLSFTLTNNSDISQRITARVCAYVNGATQPCVAHSSQVDVAGTPSIIDIIIDYTSAAFSSWTSRFGSPTDKLVKVVTFKTPDTQAVITAPKGATYAIVRAWGAAGGTFGNDNWSPFFGIAKAKTNFTPGGYGGFVAGKIPVAKGDYFTVTVGKGGDRGTRGGDNNDKPGTPGGATRVKFKDREIMVAGGGAQFLSIVYPLDYARGARTGETLSQQMDRYRTDLSSGGFQNAGVTNVTNVSASTRNTVVNTAKNTHNAGGATAGGKGKVDGTWYVTHWFDKYYIATITGGSSYIDTSVVGNATYFKGNPSSNSADKGAWAKYFTSGSKPGLPSSYDAGPGGVVVEFWGPADAEVCDDEDPAGDCFDDDLPPTVSISAPSAASVGLPFSLTWTSTNSTGCVASSTVGAGTWGGSVATTGVQSITPLSEGSKVYGITCSSSVGASSDSAVVTVGTTPLCSNGATNPPQCTTDDDGCVNGGTNPPLCTVGTCSNGATDWPTCGGTGVTSCSNGSTNPPACDDSGGFTLGQDKSVKIKVLPRGEATSEVVRVPVNRLGTFDQPVVVTVGGGSNPLIPALPSDVAISYSVNGSPFSAGPVSVTVSPADTGVNIAFRLSGKIENACATSVVTGSCELYRIAVVGADPAGTQDIMFLMMNQTKINPAYTEE